MYFSPPNNCSDQKTYLTRNEQKHCYVLLLNFWHSLLNYFARVCNYYPQLLNVLDPFKSLTLPLINSSLKPIHIFHFDFIVVFFLF